MRHGWILLFVLALGACASHYPAIPRPLATPAAGVPGIYTVARGDTLSLIGRRFGLDWNRLAELNHLSPPYRLFVGQQLAMGVPGSQETAPPPSQMAEAAGRAAPPMPVTMQPIGPGGETDRSSPTALAPPPGAPLPPPVASEDQPAQTPSGFTWPVRGEIISPFGPKPGGLHNDGVNISAAEGAPVHVSKPGTVAYAGDELRGFGNLVLVRHADGWVTAYAHLASIAVRKGQALKAGEPLGTAGHTGSVETPQLHFELRHGKDAVDPVPYLEGTKS